MSDGKQTHSSTESLIENLHKSRKKRSLLVNPDYLDDGKLLDIDKLVAAPIPDDMPYALGLHAGANLVAPYAAEKKRKWGRCF
jgi:hypothetical protein